MRSDASAAAMLDALLRGLAQSRDQLVADWARRLATGERAGIAKMPAPARPEKTLLEQR
jgi:hypothetical protein